ncbi:lipid A biosynthesis lauroyl acyltransferase [Corynebacterium renale]|nr:lipid A biosynthesis lauroyl acyltransferase [Corynebacterium renale]STC96302.1 lipid A biosynthesis lauroyl acyltransferase [Corynebacterium renale]
MSGILRFLARALGAEVAEGDSVDIATVGYLAGWKCARFIPHHLLRSLGNCAADCVSKNGRGMEQLRRNLIRVVGAENVTSHLVRDAVRSYTRYWVEAFSLSSMAGDPRVMNTIAAGVQGRERFDASYSRGKGVVLVLPHTGNWDMAGMFLVQEYGSFTTVAERVKPEVLFDAFVDFRNSLGFEVLPLTGGQAPYPQLQVVLREGGVVCLVGERDFKGSGIPVTFFDEETTMPPGAVELALSTGAALHVVHSWFDDEGWGLSVSEEIPRSEATTMQQQVADIFARNIAEHPEDWHMLQPLWPHDRELRRKRRKEAQVKKGEQ